MPVSRADNSLASKACCCTLDCRSALHHVPRQHMSEGNRTKFRPISAALFPLLRSRAWSSSDLPLAAARPLLCPPVDNSRASSTHPQPPQPGRYTRTSTFDCELSPLYGSSCSMWAVWDAGSHFARDRRDRRDSREPPARISFTSASPSRSIGTARTWCERGLVQDVPQPELSRSYQGHPRSALNTLAANC